MTRPARPAGEPWRMRAPAHLSRDDSGPGRGPDLLY